MSVTNNQFNTWMAANPGVVDPSIATTAAPPVDYAQMVRDAYGSIGRTGIGSAASNIDQAGFDYWLNSLQSGGATPEAFRQNFQTAVTGYNAAIPAPTAIAPTAAAPAPLTVEDLYQQYAGRGSDPGGLQYWTQQFGDTIDANEIQTFRDSVAYNLAQEAATASGDPRRKGIVEAIDRQEPGTQPSAIPRSALKNDALDRLNRERSDLYQRIFKPNEGVIEPRDAGYATNFASFDEYNTENPLERDVNYQLIKDGVYDYENATTEQRLRAFKRLDNPNIVFDENTNLSRDAFLEQINFLDLWNYKNNYEGKNSPGTNRPIYSSYEEYRQANPIENNATYKAIQSGSINYENAEPDEQFNKIRNITPKVAPTPGVTPTLGSEDQLIRDAYGSIGRTGIGGEASQIDQAGYDYWSNALKTGQIKPEEFQQKFRDTAADYLVSNPEDKYSTYTTDFLSRTKPAEVAGVVGLYRDVLGRDPSAAELGGSYKQFGTEISPAERANFEQSVQSELNPTVQDLYSQYMGAGRVADQEGLDYWNERFGPTIDKDEREQFRQSVNFEIGKQFGANDGTASPTTEGILSGFKYANDLGISDAGLRKALGNDAFNTYKTGFADYAKTGIANILADNKLSFDEARTAVKFGRDYGYDAQKLADLTGTNKSVYDAIFKSYDDTTNTIVDRVLGADDVKTDGDKIIKALALQQQYGVTDEDLAKATDFTPAQVKSQLDPVRNFESDYNKLRTDPNLNEDQMKTFLTTSMQNPAIKQRLGSQLQPVLDELNKPPQERILGQIESQRNALGGQYYQGVFADPKRMTEILVNKGVKSLADLGEKDKFQTTTAQAQYTSNGVPVQSPDGKNFYRTVDYGEGGTDYIPVDAKDVQTTYGKYVTEGDGENSYSAFKPLSEQEQETLKDGKYQEKLGTVVVNKRTGEELTDTSHQLAYQRSSGGLKEKKNYLSVNFTKDGTPVLTASKERAGAGAALQQALPIIAMALPFMLPGIGAALSGMLPGAGVAASGATAAIAPTLMNQALTQGIISGGLTTLGGGQFEKGFLGGAVSPVISSGIGSLLPTGMDPNIAKTITGAGTGVVKGALQGGDFSDLLSQGVLSGLTNYGLGEATKGLNLTPQQLNFATGIALPLAQGQKVNPVKLATTLAGAAR
jgi:hypothetical protein